MLADITFLTGVDENAYKKADRTRNLNQWYQRAIMDVLRSVDYEEWRDTNVAASADDNDWATSVDGTAVKDLVAGTRSYQLPTTNKVWIVRKVAYQPVAGGQWYQINPFNIAVVQAQPDDSDLDNNVAVTQPFYRLVGDQLVLYPLPAQSVTGGLKIWFVAQPDIFVTGDTIQEPTINPAFTRILTLGASYDWLSVKNPNKGIGVRQELEQVRAELRDYYGTKIEQSFGMGSVRIRYE